jgi:molybdenum cofactor cytidylyltransferase
VTVAGRITGILLAAGGARRFGSQKLVHPIDGVPLVRLAALRLLDSQIDELIVVVGNDAMRVSAALDGLSVRIVEAPSWSEGMSASLRHGVEAVSPDAAAIVVALGDQPAVDAAIVDRLIVRWRTDGSPIVAPSFRGELRPPVLFGRGMFAEIMQLRGDRGARSIVEANPERVSVVSIDLVQPLDIDRPEDLEFGAKPGE